MRSCNPVTLSTKVVQCSNLVPCPG